MFGILGNLIFMEHLLDCCLLTNLIGITYSVISLKIHFNFQRYGGLLDVAIVQILVYLFRFMFGFA